MNNPNLEISLEKLDSEMRRMYSKGKLINIGRKVNRNIYMCCAYAKIHKYAFTDPDKCEDAMLYLKRIKLNPLYEKSFIWIDFEKIGANLLGNWAE